MWHADEAGGTCQILQQAQQLPGLLRWRNLLMWHADEAGMLFQILRQLPCHLPAPASHAGLSPHARCQTWHDLPASAWGWPSPPHERRRAKGRHKGRLGGRLDGWWMGSAQTLWRWQHLLRKHWWEQTGSETRLAGGMPPQLQHWAQQWESHLQLWHRHLSQRWWMRPQLWGPSERWQRPHPRLGCCLGRCP